MHAALQTLHALRGAAGPAETVGLSDDLLQNFLDDDPTLTAAIVAAAEAQAQLLATRPALITDPESEVIDRLQAGFVNFYSTDALNPYVALAARGPWVITTHGAVVHDSGGYGMLGFGHAPEPVLEALAKPWVMANIMTAAPSQQRFVENLRAEVGHARADGCPFSRFICMNSGSEAVTVGARIADVNARIQTDPGGRHAGKRRVLLGIERAFHGRTGRPARFSHSTRPAYAKHLASFRDLADDLWTIPPGDLDALRAAFQRANDEDIFIEAFFIEPVQGEGAPGAPVTRAFYDEARRLTLEHDSILLMDSIQAGLRTWGTLSMVDYPGFEDCVPPDMETWSKALNGGQYPLSVLGLTDRAAALYRVGIYGNTMTTAPRGLEVANAVLGMITTELRQNVRDQGCNFVGDLNRLMQQHPDLITEVQGTGLLFCCELDPDRVQAIGPGSAEERCRHKGLGIIHGGRNALRFTPHLRITDAEREMMMQILGEVLAEISAEQSQAAR